MTIAIIKIITVTSIIMICLVELIRKIDHETAKRLQKTLLINHQLLSLYRLKVDEVSLLMKTLKQIKSTLSLLKLKDCPQEEFKNIPFEIIDWISESEKIQEKKENGIYK